MPAASPYCVYAYMYIASNGYLEASLLLIRLFRDNVEFILIMTLLPSALSMKDAISSPRALNSWLLDLLGDN